MRLLLLPRHLLRRPNRPHRAPVYPRQLEIVLNLRMSLVLPAMHVRERAALPRVHQEMEVRQRERVQARRRRRTDAVRRARQGDDRSLNDITRWQGRMSGPCFALMRPIVSLHPSRAYHLTPPFNVRATLQCLAFKNVFATKSLINAV